MVSTETTKSRITTTNSKYGIVKYILFAQFFCIIFFLTNHFLLQLVSLADLATGTSTVRQAQTAYLQDLINIGVAGFRFDAAKSIPPEDLAAIIGGLHKGQGDPLFVIQEVVFGQGQPITPQMYTGVSLSSGCSCFRFFELIQSPGFASPISERERHRISNCLYT